MAKLTVRELDVRNKRVFVRVDFNVPLAADGTISDDSRIRASLPTIRFLIEQDATLILASHLGKAKGRPDPAFSLKPVAARLAELLGRPVVFVPDCVGPATEKAVAAAGSGSVLLLENLRFYPGETSNDPAFCRELAQLTDLYVNDAFGTAHRAHASTAGMAALFAKPAAGLLMDREIRFLSQLVSSPARPYVAIIGGAKVSDKAGVIRNLLPKVDALLVGGGAAFSFLKARGLEIGRSLWEPELLDEVRSLLSSPKLRLPSDIVVAASKDAPSATTVPVEQIPSDQAGFDIGPITQAQFAGEIAGARTTVWAGPMGVFENPAFSAGTRTVASAMSEATAGGATTVAGGGDTAAALARLGFQDKVTHVSTGGSASLEFLEGRTLPGIAALADA
ncbi:MAG: phosphoglycerate kinase [candidate division WOR-3 bacterium]